MGSALKVWESQDEGGSLSRPDFDLRDYLLPGVTAGTGLGVEAKLLVWINAGSGEVLSASPTSLTLDLRASLFGRERAGRVQMIIEPPVPGPQGEIFGACGLAAGRQIDGDARYWVEKGQLVAEGKLYDRDVHFRVGREGRHCIVEVKQPKSIKLRFTFDGSEV